MLDIAVDRWRLKLQSANVLIAPEFFVCYISISISVKRQLNDSSKRLADQIIHLEPFLHTSIIKIYIDSWFFRSYSNFGLVLAPLISLSCLALLLEDSKVWPGEHHIEIFSPCLFNAKLPPQLKLWPSRLPPAGSGSPTVWIIILARTREMRSGIINNNSIFKYLHINHIISIVFPEPSLSNSFTKMCQPKDSTFPISPHSWTAY